MKKHMTRVASVVAIVSIFALIAGCATAPRTVQGKADIRAEADAAIAKARSTDPSMNNVLRNAAGYAVFPSVGKGGAGLGGAYGKGVLYVNGRAVGYCDLTQASIGAQLGGQSYTEIICFETNETVERFKQGNFQFGAQVSAVALKSGVGANAKYAGGVAVFTTDETGLMAEAAVGGQKFSYQVI